MPTQIRGGLSHGGEMGVLMNFFSTKEVALLYGVDHGKVSKTLKNNPSWFANSKRTSKNGRWQIAETDLEKFMFLRRNKK